MTEQALLPLQLGGLGCLEVAVPVRLGSVLAKGAD